MISVSPSAMTNVAAFRPILDMLDSVLLTPGEVAAHYRYTEEHLCNLRKAKRGWPFLKLATGGIRYRVSEIIGSELAGTDGPLTLERVCQALAACADLTPPQRAAAQAHVLKAFGSGG